MPAVAASRLNCSSVVVGSPTPLCLLCTHLADFEKPFDSPAILVVGHQTDGKSALVEALMGQ